MQMIDSLERVRAVQEELLRLMGRSLPTLRDFEFLPRWTLLSKKGTLAICEFLFPHREDEEVLSVRLP